MKIQRVQLACMIALLGAPSLSTALGWGNARTSAVLGRPLDFAVPVRVEPGEEFAPECVDAEVHFGESRVSGSQVQVRVEPLPGAGGERLVRVQTTASIEEPIVSVQVATGCRARLVRKFVAFADPPLV
ncbi:type IV pilus assembly protein FimV, partial [Acinetobacter baumannii]|uniref:type IV pilus assembly protein FimV n=1 Tax=Acinetobacter baumannii TaxID=470 RepID=UPI0018E09423